MHAPASDGHPRRLVRADERRRCRPGCAPRCASAAWASVRPGRRQDVAKARTRDSMRIFAKRTCVDDEPQIVAEPPLIVPIDDLIRRASAGGRPTRSSTSSSSRTAGRSCAGATPSRSSATCTWPARWSAWAASGPRLDPAVPRPRRRGPAVPAVQGGAGSVLERFLGKRPYDKHGQRVVVGQRLMQAASDIFLGWLRVRGSTGSRATTTSASSTTGRARRCGDHARAGGDALRPMCARRWPGRTPASATASRSPRTWARATRSTGPRRLLGRLRRPERARLRHPGQGGEEGTAQGRDRAVDGRRRRFQRRRPLYSPP